MNHTSGGIVNIRTMYQSIIIDGNNLYNRNYHVNKNLTFIMDDGTELITGGIFGFMRSLGKLRRKYLSDHGKFYILFDNHASKANMRREVDSNYKKNRKKKPKSFYRSIELLQQILLHYDNDIVLIYRTDYEADDLVKPVIASVISEYDRILLVSDDLDWARMMGYEGRPIEWLAGGKIYNAVNFEEKYGYYPSENNIVMWKTFRGDTVDNIPVGVPGIRKEIIFKLMEDCSDIFDIMLHIDRIDYLGIWKERIKEAETRLKLNHQLVSFIGIGKEELEEFVYGCEYRPNNLKIFYDALGFNIKTFDLRVYNDLEKKKEKVKSLEDDFFKQPEIKRI